MSGRNPVKLSKNWVEIFDPNSGKPYYANRQTNEVTWVKPVDRIAAELAEEEPQHESPAAARSQKEDVWVERIDPNTGRTYYFNPAKGSTSWYRPEKLVTTDIHKQPVLAGVSQWKEHVDPRTKLPYYYNQALGITSWTNPEAEAEAKPHLSTKGGGALSAVRRVSARISQSFTGGVNRPDSTRGSARFSLAVPGMPVNKSSGRESLRLGDLSEAGDKFAALRALQAKKPQAEIGGLNQEKQPPRDALRIDLKREMDTLDFATGYKDIRAYAEEHVSTRQKKCFGSSNVSIDVFLDATRQPIKKALHKMTDKNLQADALTAFKFLLAYTKDRPMKSKSDAEVAQEFATLGTNTVEVFRSELYLQLIKQTTNSLDPKKTLLVFELIALCCGCFKPSDAFEPYLKSFLSKTIATPVDDNIRMVATYAFLRLERATERLSPPSLEEVTAVRSVTPVNLVVELTSAKPLNLQIDAWSTVGEVKGMIEAHFQIKDGTPFSLFEVAADNTERALEDKDNMLDVLSYWETERGAFRALYKIRLYFDINEEDTAAIELAYLQAVYEVVDQRYPCEQNDAVILAALEAQEKFGDYNDTDVLGDDLVQFIPRKYFNPEDPEPMKRAIYKEYKKLKGGDKLQCMINYLNYVKNWKYYGSQYYFADPVQLKILGKEFPKKVIIAINSKGCLIIDPDSLELIVEYPYSELVTWGHSEANFVLVVGNLVRSTKLFFSTIDGFEMNSLIFAYVNKLMEAQTEEEEEERILNQFKE